MECDHTEVADDGKEPFSITRSLSPGTIIGRNSLSVASESTASTAEGVADDDTATVRHSRQLNDVEMLLNSDARGKDGGVSEATALPAFLAPPVVCVSGGQSPNRSASPVLPSVTSANASGSNAMSSLSRPLDSMPLTSVFLGTLHAMPPMMGPAGAGADPSAATSLAS